MFWHRTSIRHLECRAVLGPRAAVIIDPRRRDVRMSQPLLHLGDVSLMIERIGGSSRTERVRADLEAELRRIRAHQLIDPIGRDRAFELAGAVIPDRAEQRAVVVGAVPGNRKIVVNEGACARMQRQIPGLAAFAGHPEMRHAFARVVGILDLQLA